MNTATWFASHLAVSVAALAGIEDHKPAAPRDGAAQAPRSAAHGFELSLKADESKVVAGQACDVIVELSNSSDRPFAILDLSPPSYVGFVVRGPEGVKTSRTVYGKDQKGPTSGEGFGTGGPVLRKGDSTRLRYNLSRRFDLTVPGTYEVRAYAFPELMGEGCGGPLGRVESKPILISIVDEPWSAYQVDERDTKSRGPKRNTDGP